MTTHLYKQFKSREALYEVTKDKISALLLESLTSSQKASLFLSGGSTPGPVYEALSHVDLPWENVNVGLVDDRWVDADNSGSNEKLIKATLIKNKAAVLNFSGMKTKHASPQEAQTQVDRLYKNIVTETSVAILGMGTDGHVCSWFPNSDGLEQTLNPNNKAVVQAIKAQKTKVTGDFLHRMTLSFKAIATCRSVILLITGEEKKQIIDIVLAGDAPHLPVAHLLKLKSKQLSIFHAR